MNESLPFPLGLIAGQGDLPLRIIKRYQALGLPIFVVAIEKQTPLETVADVDHLWIKIGELGRVIKALKARTIQDITFAGGIKRPDFNSLSLDWKGVKFLGMMGYKTLGDDGLLTRLIQFLEAEKFRIIPPNHLLKDLSPSEGILTHKVPTGEDQQDIQKGINVLDLMAKADIGQAIIVQRGHVLGMEAAEGTKGLIQRVRDYKVTPLGGVLIKKSKINQNLKIDLPTIGIQTLHQIYDSRLNGVALEAGSSQMIDQPAMIDLANTLGVFIYIFEKNHS